MVCQKLRKDGSPLAVTQGGEFPPSVYLKSFAPTYAAGSHLDGTSIRKYEKQFRLFLQLLPEQTQQFVELTLHSDHLLTHVKSDLGSL